MTDERERLSRLKQYLDHLDACRGVASPEIWLRQYVGERGLRDLYAADYLIADEFEKWIGELYSLPGVLMEESA